MTLHHSPHQLGSCVEPTLRLSVVAKSHLTCLVSGGQCPNKMSMKFACFPLTIRPFFWCTSLKFLIQSMGLGRLYSLQRIRSDWVSYLLDVIIFFFLLSYSLSFLLWGSVGVSTQLISRRALSAYLRCIAPDSPASFSKYLQDSDCTASVPAVRGFRNILDAVIAALAA